MDGVSDSGERLCEGAHHIGVHLMRLRWGRLEVGERSVSPDLRLLWPLCVESGTGTPPTARDGERIGNSRGLGVARVCREVGSVATLAVSGEWNGSQPGHPIVWTSQGQCWGRCRVRPAERVIRPTRAKTQIDLRVLVVTVRSARPMQQLSSGLTTWLSVPAPAPPARRRWRRSAHEGRWLSPTTVFQVSNGVHRSRQVAAMMPPVPGFPRHARSSS